jgi:hypothetical protein
MIKHALRFTLTALALAAASSAQARIEISTNTFDLVSSDEADMMNTNPLAGHLISTSNNASTFAFPSFTEALNFPLANYSNGNLHDGTFTLNVHNGFQITGIKFSGTLTGQLQAARVPTGDYYYGQDGVASNHSQMWMTVGTSLYGNDLGQRSVTYDSTNGSREFSLSMNRLELTGQKNLELTVVGSTWAENSFWTYAYGDSYFSGGDFSYASFSVLNPTLTFYTAPVPEPETYAMMLAGLAGLGLMARRRAAKANKA